MTKYVKFFLIVFFLLTTVSNTFADDCSKERVARPRVDMPEEIKDLKNPLPDIPENISQGKNLFLKDAKPAPCYRCHGKNGRGDGVMGKYLKPKPRNFTCKNIMSKLSDGHLFWIIRKGARGSAMAGFNESLLSDENLWKIILYIKTLSK